MKLAKNQTKASWARTHTHPLRPLNAEGIMSPPMPAVTEHQVPDETRLFNNHFLTAFEIQLCPLRT